MTDPRDTARQWLAGRHAAAFNKCWHSNSCGEPCPACLVEAILTAPGVKVGEERWAYDSDGDRIEACAPSNYVEPTHTQVVIGLPPEEAT